MSLAVAGYLVLSFGLWWHVWTNHPTTTSICGCGDTSLFTWFLEWPAYAMSHGLDPLYSTAMGYPHGVNLLSNTSMLAVGVPLAPVTWTFGPIATLNVALFLGPVLSAMAMFVLLRRWASWAPAAFVGGLLYGFSPLVLTNIDYSHLNLTFSLVPPLAVACLDELLIRQRRRPVVTGVLLGLLMTLQFFLSTELLVIMVLGGTFAVVVVVAYAAWRSPQVLRQRARFALVGLAAGSATVVILLAYPAWFALAGPAHLSGAVWGDLGSYTSAPGRYLLPTPVIPLGWQSGFEGVITSDQYMGLGLVAVLVGGLLIWRRDLKLRLFAIIAAWSVVLALGAANPVFGSLPIFENILPSRFNAILYLSAAIMLGLVVDHVHAAVKSRSGSVQPVDLRGAGAASWARGWTGALTALIVAGIALVPIAAYLSPNVPIPVQSLRVPSWFRTVAPHLEGRQVLLVFPANIIGESPMTWQVLDGMRYSMVDEGGPGASFTRAGREEQGQEVLFDVSQPAFATANSGGSAAVITPPKITAVRSALLSWGVTTVVLPAQRNLLPLQRVPSVPAVAALVTAATGLRPVYEKGVWIWSSIDHPRPPVATTTSKFSTCTSGRSGGRSGVDVSVACIASKGPFLRIVGSANGLHLLQNGLLVTTVADSAAVTGVEFAITGNGMKAPLTVPARRFVDGSLAGWSANVAALNLPHGTYTLRSVATDAGGAIGRSPDRTMRIDDRTRAVLPPTTNVVKPTAGAQLRGEHALAATASSALGVRHVEFRISGNGRTLVEQASQTLFGWLCLWDTRAVPDGTYTVSSVADGNTGLQSTSRAVAVEVTNHG